MFVLEFDQSIRVHWPDLDQVKAWACRLRHGRDFVFAIAFVFCIYIVLDKRHTCGLGGQDRYLHEEMEMDDERKMLQHNSCWPSTAD